MRAPWGEGWMRSAPTMGGWRLYQRAMVPLPPMA